MVGWKGEEAARAMEADHWIRMGDCLPDVVDTSVYICDGGRVLWAEEGRGSAMELCRYDGKSILFEAGAWCNFSAYDVRMIESTDILLIFFVYARAGSLNS